MKNIILLCSAGMSTSMMVNKMKEAAALEEYDCDINAYSISEAPTVGVNADVILLGPQVRFNVKKIRDQFPDKTVDSIDMTAYGTMDGKKVIEQVKKLLGD